MEIISDKKLFKKMSHNVFSYFVLFNNYKDFQNLMMIDKFFLYNMKSFIQNKVKAFFKR
jgi:hypothetical protein